MTVCSIGRRGGRGGRFLSGGRFDVASCDEEGVEDVIKVFDILHQHLV